MTGFTPNEFATMAALMQLKEAAEKCHAEYAKLMEGPQTSEEQYDAYDELASHYDDVACRAVADVDTIISNTLFR